MEPPPLQTPAFSGDVDWEVFTWSTSFSENTKTKLIFGWSNLGEPFGGVPTFEPRPFHGEATWATVARGRHEVLLDHQRTGRFNFAAKLLYTQTVYGTSQMGFLLRFTTILSIRVQVF